MKKKILFFVFLSAFLIRLIAINQSLWLDEATTARVVKELGFLGILGKFSPSDFHPPLYYLFMKLWTNIFGYSEIALRMPSVLFSLATGYIVYLIAGIWGAVFFLFNPLIVYYSQEARMYMMATFFLTGALYFFLKKKYFLFGVLGGLGLLTFYGSIFFIAAFLVYFLYKKQFKNLFICLFLIFSFFLLISPLLYKQLLNAKINLANVTNWSYVLGKANLKNLLLIPVKFSIGRIDFYPKWLYYGIAGGWVSFILSQMLNLKSQIQNSNRKTIYLFYYLFIFPLVLGFVISFVTPLLQYFRFLYLIPVMAILLSFRLSGRALYNRFGCTALTVGFITFSLIYLLFPQFHREDWKSLAKSLPNDKQVYMIASSSDPVKYYNPSLLIKELTRLRQDYGGQSELEEEIIVIPYTADIHGIDYKKTLEERNYLLTAKKTFRNLELEEYSRR